MTSAETLAYDKLLAGLEDDWQGASKHLSMFIDEAQRTLDEMIEALLALEAGRGRENVERLFVAAHRLKGSAASLGLGRIAKLAHLAEDLLQDLVDNGGELTPQTTNALLAFVDAMRECVESLRQGQPDEGQFDGVARELAAARNASDNASPNLAQPPSAASQSGPGMRPSGRAAAGALATGSQIPPDLHRLVAITVREDQRDTALVGKAVFEPDLPLAGLKARLLYEKLSNLGEVCYFDPPADEVENLEKLDAVAFGVVTEKPPQAVGHLLRQAGTRWMAIEPLAQPFASQPLGTQLSPAAPIALAQPKTAAPPTNPAETLRVNVARLDQLMNLAGQLSIGQSRLAKIGGRLKEAVAGHKPAETLVGQLVETIEMLQRAGGDVQRAALDMRMALIGPLFARFHRAVRDIARANGKDIRLLISGEKTELDKRMIDQLCDPLIHAIRNAADHGIESPQDRAAVGKPRQGTISLDACHRAGNVVIRVSDDGRGLDAERLRAKAVEMGLLSPANAQGATPRELLYRLAWTPGLSTAEKPSEVSGRGMGMGIVKSTIEKLGGAVELESEPGRGTTVVIKLPLTLAILPSLMVEASGEAFAIPLESVAEIVDLGQGNATTVGGRLTALVRGRVLPILTLQAAFNKRWTDCRSAPATLVVLGPPDRQIGLAVDRVFGQENVVVKSLAANYRNVAGVAGAGISGEGRVFLILDPPTLMENVPERK